MTLNPVALAQDLIRRPSVTPADAGAMDVLQTALEGIGFACRRMKFGEIENLYARRGLQGARRRGQREQVIDSPAFRSQFSDGERSTIRTLLMGYPYSSGTP